MLEVEVGISYWRQKKIHQMIRNRYRGFNEKGCLSNRDLSQISSFFPVTKRGIVPI